MSDIVKINYTNWRGERKDRRVLPFAIRFGSNQWHPDEQWLLVGLDVEKGGGEDDARREFAMKDIHSWVPET